MWNTNKTRQSIEDYASALADRIKQLEGFILEHPGKVVRSKKHRNSVFYRYKDLGQNSEWHYVRRASENSFRKYARHQYARRTLPILKRDLAILNKLLSGFSWKNELRISELIDPALIKLCGKGFVAKAEHIENWINQEWFESPSYDDSRSHPTLAGFNVRSKSEEFIANALFNHGLPFLYEKPLYIKGASYPKFPDFTILHPETLEEVYWEHFGLMDDPVYANTACKKLQEYTRSGIFPGQQLICTFETYAHPLSSTDVEAVIMEYFVP